MLNRLKSLKDLLGQGVDDGLQAETEPRPGEPA